jgi:hypothetical protein
VLLLFLVACVVLFFILTFRVVMSVTISTLKRCSVRLYLHLFVGGLMSYLSYLCSLTYSGIQHILCCVLVWFFFDFCTICCQFLWIAHLFMIASSLTVYLQNTKLTPLKTGVNSQLLFYIFGGNSNFTYMV